MRRLHPVFLLLVRLCILVSPALNFSPSVAVEVILLAEVYLFLLTVLALVITLLIMLLRLTSIWHMCCYVVF